jgi:hypothetical protein
LEHIQSRSGRIHYGHKFYWDQQRHGAQQSGGSSSFCFLRSSILQHWSFPESPDLCDGLQYQHSRNTVSVAERNKSIPFDLGRRDIYFETADVYGLGRDYWLPESDRLHQRTVRRDCRNNTDWYGFRFAVDSQFYDV